MRSAALALGLLALPPAQAQGLAEALERAWLRHPQAVASQARDEEARARAELAAGLTPGPGAISLSGLDDRFNRNRGKQEWEVEMAMPLWLPGQQQARAAEADDALAQVAAQRLALRLQLAGEVREAWWAAAAARNINDLAGRRLETARVLEADVQRRYRAGELARLDANLAQTERLAAEAELADAGITLLHAEQGFRRLTGMALPAALPAESTAADELPRDDHPQLAAAAAAVQLARARLRLAAATRREAPELALRAVRERGEFTAPYANSVGVKLTIPFSSGPRLRQENAAARAELAQADAELALARLRLQLDLEKSRRDLDAAERQLEMARQRRELTADNLRLAEKSFALGESDLPALLRVRTAAFEAAALSNRQQVAQAAAQSRLKQALGALP